MRPPRSGATPGYVKMRAFSGKQVVLTRPLTQATPLQRALEALGARVCLAPLIRTEAVQSPEVTEGLRGLGRFDWVAFTSANGVRHLEARLAELRVSLPESARIAVIGLATARAVEAAGFRVSLAAEESSSEGLANAFSGVNLRGKRVALLVAQETRDLLRPLLGKMGAEVSQLGIYRTVADESGVLALRGIDWSLDTAVVFMSGSAAEVFVRHSPVRATDPVRYCAIGQITAQRLSQLGLRADAIAEEPSNDGVVAALGRFWPEPHS